MKKFFLRILYSTAITLAIVIIVLLSIGKQPFNRFVEQQLIALAQSRGIKLALSNTSLSFVGVTADSGEVFFPQALVLLPFNKLQITPRFSDLLLGALGINVDAEIAQGDSKFSAAARSANEVVINAAINNALLADLPVLAFLGFNNGKMTSSVEDAQLKNGQLIKGAFSFNASQIERSSTAPIKISISNFPFSLQLPKITNGSLTAAGELEANTLKLRKLESLSSLGSFSISGDLKLSDARIVQQITLKGDVHLSESAHEAFKSFLPLISQGVLKLDTKSFSFNISGTPPAVKSRFFDLG